jgi:hypothetical protein
MHQDIPFIKLAKTPAATSQTKTNSLLGETKSDIAQFERVKNHQA